MADLINVSDLEGRARELQALNVHIVCVHTAHDALGSHTEPMANVQSVRKATACCLAVAGGLQLENVDQAIHSGANILVFGSSVAMHSAPGQIAQEIMTRIRRVAS
jgi:3-hexulose-6-phosphate synthase